MNKELHERLLLSKHTETDLELDSDDVKAVLALYDAAVAIRDAQPSALSQYEHAHKSLADALSKF